ncbi:hypothetical protein PUN28_008240 [Cardiocondyla obscurior]|uniref:Uncharacterized protein n=1 Tax=Cardiocondyla obscurior TaxID=286306 RepID=A0AAW2FYE6_9HYME
MPLSLTYVKKSPETGASQKKTRRSKRKTKTTLTPELVSDSPPSPLVEVAQTPRITSIKVFPSQQPLAEILRLPRTRKPVRHAHFQLLDWRPPLANFTPPSLTRPPRIFMVPGDVRVWRYTSPRWNKVARAVSPIPPTPPLRIERGTQVGSSTTERAIQHAPVVTESGTQYDPWASTSSSEVEVVTLPGDEKWGPIKVTLTAPHISYRERRL